MSLTTYASTYPEMDTFPVTWTKLTCQSLMGVCISESDFCRIRVMSDPESIITLVRFLSSKLKWLGLEQLGNQGKSTQEVTLGASLILPVAWIQENY